MAISARRFLVVPDPAFDNAEVVSVVPVTGETPNEAGRQVAQPTRSTTDTPEGDIAMTLSGEPEAHVEGVARCTRAGVVEDARWGWLRDGDDPETDLQLRQSPHVIGRRPDVVSGAILASPLATARAVRPRLLPLRSGDCLMVWTTRYWMPIWARDATTLGTGQEVIRLSKLSAATDAWSTAADGPVPQDVVGTGAFISAVDITQFPDTAEIVMCVMTSTSMTPGNTDPRMLFVYVSQDDGSTWVLKHRLHFDGPIPDIVLDADGDGDVDDLTAFQDIALELLDSGRLCIFGVTESYTWSLVSDDRGASWSAILISTHGISNNYAGHGVGATKARNGMGCFTRALRDGTDGIALSTVSLFFSRDGVSWSTPISVPQTTVIYETVDVTVCVSPDGWPHVYGTEHASKEVGVSTPTNSQDWIWGRRLTERDPTIADVATTVLPNSATMFGPAPAFHMGTGTPLGSYAVPAGAEDINPCRYDGFVGLDAVLYRGQVLMAVVHQRDGVQPDTDEQPKLASYGLMVYRLSHWQPIQERVADAYQDVSGTNTYEPAWPAIGRIYNTTWDCYDTPDNEGWSKTGGVTPTFSYAGTSGGYMQVAGGPCSWDHVPNGDVIIGLGANLRFVVAVESGGSTATDAIAVRLSLNDGVGHSDVSIRMKRTGNLVEFQLYDNINAANIGPSKSITHNDWVEVLYAQHRGPGSSTSLSVYCAARSYARSTDPDWDAPYTMIVDGSTLTVGVPSLDERIRFGHFTSGTQTSSWKGIHLSRSWTASGLPLAREKCSLYQVGADYDDSDASNDRSTTGTGEAPLDDGLDNYMRSCRMLSSPPMFMCRGTAASFRGEAVTAGAWDYTTGYAFAASNVQIQPVLREWRAVNDQTIISMVFQAPTGRAFRPDALAMFGHNVAGFAFQFNDTDSWGTPAVSFGLSLPPFGSLNRYFHEWATDTVQSPANPLDALGNRVRVNGMSPWRPHQFKSDPGGQQHYVALKANGTSAPQIFRIIDNTVNTLILQTDVDGTGITLEGSGAIFSDRLAVMIGHHFPANPMTGYAYCRIVIGQGKHWDADAQFARIGRIILGTTVEISAPDFEMGWTTGYESGSVVVEQPTGAAYTHRLRPILRTWQADRPWMMPPEEADAVYASPSSQPVRASWAQWLDTMRLIDGDGTACALVWEGERFVGFTGEERVQVCTDPLALAMCHVVGLGDLEQTVYDGRTENLPDGPGCVPRPVSHIRGLRFRETL